VVSAAERGVKPGEWRRPERVLPAGIARQISAEGGLVTFARFMDLALTHPSDGYYRSVGGQAGTLLGRRGHFSTAPQLSPAFRRAVARLLAELVDASLAAEVSHARRTLGTQDSNTHPVALVELGGGEGDLAMGVLQELGTTRPDLRTNMIYTIVELSNSLRMVQEKILSPFIDGGWQVAWSPDLKGAAAGARPTVIVSNEFFDALPVHVIDVHASHPLEAWVVLDSDENGVVPREVWRDLSAEAAAELDVVFGRQWRGSDMGEGLRASTRDNIIELRPAARALMREAAGIMPQGSLLTIDYGEWFAKPQAGQNCACSPTPLQPYRRTLRGYFRHQLVSDPYVRVGRQDLTADVDFRALHLHGRESGFEAVLCSSVAALLKANGAREELDELQQQAGISLEADREAAILQGLLDDEGLGGAFKLLLQVKE
jgi:SAM-dependent MidA family methyltransferase